MTDFKREAMQQRFKVLQAAKAQAAANIATYEAQNDTDSAADEIQAYSNLESEEANLVASYNRHLAPRPQAPPMSDQEYHAMSPERLAQSPEALNKILRNSKHDFIRNIDWSEPDVARRIAAGEAEATARRREGR